MNNLTQQLENEREKLIFARNHYNVESVNIILDKIAILEQAIAELQKQRQEILDKIDKCNLIEILRKDISIRECEDWIKDKIKQQLNQPKTEE